MSTSEQAVRSNKNGKTTQARITTTGLLCNTASVYTLTKRTVTNDKGISLGNKQVGMHRLKAIFESLQIIQIS